MALCVCDGSSIATAAPLSAPPRPSTAAPAPAAAQTAAPPAAQKRLERLPNVARSRGRSGGYDAVQASANLQPALLDAQEPAEPVAQGRVDEAWGVTLDDVTYAAMTNSPLVREAEAQAAAARGRAYQASMYPNPTMGSQGPQLAGNQSQYNVFVAQDLVTKGKIRLDTAAADRAAREAELNLIRVRFEVLTMVRQRWAMAMANQMRAEVLERMVGIARSSEEIGQRLLKAGIGNLGNVLLLQIELTKAEAEYRNAITLTETSKRQLAAATGIIDLQIPRVRGDFAQPMPDFELYALQQGVMARNALAQSARVEIDRSQFVLRRAEVEPFPNFNFMGGYQYQLAGAGAPTDQAVYQVQAVVPLWNRNRGNIRAAQANIGAAMAQLNRVNTELANDAANALGQYVTARRLADQYETKILPNAVKLQDISLQLYRQGQADFLLYLNAQRALLDANLAYISAQEARWIAAARVAGLLQSEQFP